MENTTRSILPLPPHVAAQIASSISIPSLASVVLGLIANSLDAEASKIDISVDFSRGVASVEDNGVGIPPKEFSDSGGLGKTFHTSKNHNSSDTYGRNGTFLASLAALSTLTITSHHSAHLQHASLILHHSRPAARLIPAPLHLHLSSREHGTRVTVQNLFGSMPVRIKQRALDAASGESEKHLESLRKQIIGLLLAWHMPITVSLKSAKNNKALRIWSKNDLKPSEGRDERPLRVLDLPLVCNIFSQAGHIEPSNWGDWIKTSARTPFIKINGAICLKPAPSKHLQYISLGISPMNAGTGSNVLYHEVNRLFTLSSFGNQEEALDTEKSLKTERRKDGRFKQDGFTNKQLKGEGKGVDRWPMFYICIEIQGENTRNKDDVEKLGESTLTGLIKVLGAMITGFLDENHFRPRARRRARMVTELRTPEVSRRGPESHSTRSSNVPTNRTQIRHGEDAFNGCGRIKSGIQVKPSGKSLLGLPGSQDMKGQTSRAASPQIDSGAASNISITDETGRNEAMDATHDESTIEWRNPISGAAVLVNARTGLVVSKQLSTRPATAPSKLGSQLSFTTSNLHMNPLPNGKTRLTRIMSSSSGTKAGSWSSDLLKTWQNPVFDVTEEAIPQVSLDGPSLETSDTLHGRHCCPNIEIEKAFKQSLSSYLTKLSRQALKDARIIAQVDQKFILVCMSESPSADGQGQARQLLVLVDQHAADERIRVEGLLAGLDSRPTLLVKPIAFEIPDRERALLDRHIPYFTTWGINYDVKNVADSAKCRLTVKALPAAIAERCRVEPKVLIELLRGEAWKREELGLLPKAIDHDPGLNVPKIAEKAGWLARLSSCPQGLLDMLNSRACRSAIMFNDALTKDECETLIQRLAECAFPFQCAHGRPSTVPLVDVGSDTGSALEMEGPEGSFCDAEDDPRAFGEAWRAWRGSGEGLGLSAKESPCA